jgi:hypothetical protein
VIVFTRLIQDTRVGKVGHQKWSEPLKPDRVVCKCAGVRPRDRGGQGPSEPHRRSPASRAFGVPAQGAAVAVH